MIVLLWLLPTSELPDNFLRDTLAKSQSLLNKSAIPKRSGIPIMRYAVSDFNSISTLFILPKSDGTQT